MDLDALIQTAIAAKVIDPERHGALMRNPVRIAQRANIPMRLLFTSAVGLVSDAEYDWFKGYHQHASNGTAGLLIASKKPVRPILDRFSAVAAWAIRNGLMARVLLMQDIIDLMKAEEMPEPDVLLVPDFLMQGYEKQPWVAPRMASLLHSRHVSGKQTALYAEAELATVIAMITSVYGSTTAQLVHSHYDKGNE